MPPQRPIIRAADLQPRPWPNGLGTTRDAVAQNRDATGFDWLISIADLVESAAFSHFPDCDRIFTLIEGDGVTLTLDGASAMACRPLVPACFPGDRPTFCTLAQGPGRAFNLFVDRRGFDGQVTICTIAGAHAVHSGEDTVAIFCAAGALHVDGHALEPGDTATGHGPAAILAPSGGAIAIIVEIRTRDAAA